MNTDDTDRNGERDPASSTDKTEQGSPQFKDALEAFMQEHSELLQLLADS